ncbi:hypothetical protein [Silvanigrella aquatica]|uniref:Helix-turn-helix domain-containing protein n=1 Tax=Silvanigrella aquatica TaxID=1915309 RepID=A0A1L4CX90_9BACT|nr:hypothetical protein [Silvanigrella aquatica]APJ02564.1 hypothetical protein AXG55_00890 [Silvanigrella aquatica]
MAIKLKKNNENGQWLKLNDAAQLLQVSEITLRRKLKSGKLKSEIRDGKYFIFVQDTEVKEKKNDLVYFESFIAEKESELRDLKKQISDQKILINALEYQLNLVKSK